MVCCIWEQCYHFQCHCGPFAWSSAISFDWWLAVLKHDWRRRWQGACLEGCKHVWNAHWVHKFRFLMIIEIWYWFESFILSIIFAKPSNMLCARKWEKQCPPPKMFDPPVYATVEAMWMASIITPSWWIRYARYDFRVLRFVDIEVDDHHLGSREYD